MSNEITLCLLVKNEARFITGCLESVKDVCDHIIVVDSGSTDGTFDLAGRYTSHRKRLPFSDFAKNRNAVLDEVQTPWALFLDADERFERDQASSLPMLTKEQPENVWGIELVRHNLFRAGGWFTDRRVRLFRSTPLIRYRGIINEDVSESILEHGGRISRAPTFFNHLGYCRPILERHQKTARYIDLFRKHLEQCPNDALRRSRLAVYLTSIGKLDEATEESAKTSGESDSALLRFQRGIVLRALGRLDEAHEEFSEAWRGERNNGVFANMVGVIEMMKGQADSAAATLAEAFHVEPTLAPVQINQGLLAQSQGQMEDATKLFRTAAEMNPALLMNDWNGRLAFDPWGPFLYDTIPGYAGLAFHLAASSAS
jgi:glycosyltransferase involved in cell wall biosynthesis